MAWVTAVRFRIKRFSAVPVKTNSLRSLQRSHRVFLHALWRSGRGLQRPAVLPGQLPLAARSLGAADLDHRCESGPQSKPSLQRGGRCRLATVGNGIALWDAEDRTRITLSPDSNAEAIAISADGSTIATGGWGPTVAVWSATFITDDRTPVELAPAGGLSAVDALSQTTARLADDGQSIDVTTPRGPPHRIAVRADGLVVVPHGLRLVARQLRPQTGRLGSLAARGACVRSGAAPREWGELRALGRPDL